jgi:hypothetical protein
MEGYMYKTWYSDGEIHRDGDRPAVIDHRRQVQVWYKKGKRHREGGQPAVIESNGKQQWYLDGQCIRSE